LVRALIAGASGFIGGRLVPALVDDGFDVACLVRDAEGERATDLSFGGCEVFEADLSAAGDLEQAMRGADVAYFMVHMMGRADDYAGAEAAAALRFAEAATRAGVRQMVYLGGLGDRRSSPHLASRHATALVLRDHGPPLTYFRAAMVIGAGSESYLLLRNIVERLPVLPDAAWMRRGTQPIGAREVIRYLRQAPFVPEALGREIEIGGPEVLSPLELVDRMALAMGRRAPPKVAVPGATPSAIAAGAEVVSKGHVGVAAELALGLSSDTVVRDTSGARLFDVTPEPLDVSLQRALEEDERLAATGTR
jgi:uncharacterized protein YbjT (DUF2867 family)